MYTTAIAQMNILIEGFAILISIVVLVLLATGGDENSRLTRLFMRIVICNIAAILCDTLAWVFDGNIAAHAAMITRAAKFMTYVLQFLLIPLLSDYVTELIGRKTQIGKTVSRVMYALFGLAFLSVVLSQRGGAYYTFDEANHYRVGDLFWLSQTIGTVFLIIITAFILRHRKSMGKSDTLFLLSYPLFPILAMGIHVFALHEVEFIFIATTLSIVTSYGGIQVRQARLQIERELQFQRELLEMEKELNESKIAIMLSQIHPHFLYNTLSAIQDLCVEDPSSAQQAVIEFSQYLRGNLDSLGISRPIPFEQELKHVETYLALEKKRFDENLNIIYDIRSRDFSLPTLSLQLIVENAVRHGATKRAGGGTVTIKTAETESAYVITVEDDGVGFDPGKVPPDDGCSHVGIENVRSRLEAMCGGTLHIESTPGEGTTAVITIPK